MILRNVRPRDNTRAAFSVGSRDRVPSMHGTMHMLQYAVYTCTSSNMRWRRRLLLLGGRRTLYPMEEATTLSRRHHVVRVSCTGWGGVKRGQIGGTTLSPRDRRIRPNQGKGDICRAKDKEE